MTFRNAPQLRNAPHRIVCWLLAACSCIAACSVDFKDFVYDDDAFEQSLGGAPGQDDEKSPPSKFCRTFCDDSAAFCAFGSALGYDSEQDCLSACSTFDTYALECRLVEVGQAEDDPDDHCPATLLDGGGVCPNAAVRPCAAFCDDASVTCPFGSERGYASKDECLDVCADLTEGAFDCREIHLGFAQEGNPELHCLHTLLDGGGVCPDATPDPCVDFCTGSAETCPFGTELGYASEEECLALCDGYDEDALDCRVVHLGFAQEGSAETHCPHTLENGEPPCSDESQ